MGLMLNSNCCNLCKCCDRDAVDCYDGFIVHPDAYVRHHGIVYTVARLNGFKRLLRLSGEIFVKKLKVRIWAKMRAYLGYYEIMGTFTKV